MVEVLGKQVASPVQFVRGLRTLYDAGARVFVEVGPKRALHGFVEDVLGGHDDVLALFTNHPKQGDICAFNQALCGLWAAGLGFGAASSAQPADATRADAPATAIAPMPPVSPTVASPIAASSVAPARAPTFARSPPVAAGDPADDRILQLGRLFAGVLEQGLRLYGAAPAAQPPALPTADASGGADLSAAEPVVITGAALGLPGVDQVFDDGNIGRILAGQQMITALPDAVQRRMADMHITRLVKKEAGGAEFETIDDPSEVIKLAGRHAPLDVVEQFAVDTARDEALDITTRLAIGAGFDALRDAGIPLVMRYKTTTLGTQLPDRWGLPDALRDETGVIFASAFPGYNRFAEELEAYATDRTRREHLLALEGVRARMTGSEPSLAEIERLIAELRAAIAAQPYQFDRRFLFRVLAMGHSQFAELIGARGPNTQINAACASTTQALTLAEDWIRAGRCRRVIVVSADDATGDALLPWITSGFLASGAAATDAKVEDAATPFDRRRHGMIVGMGAAALVVESAESARERGLQPICEVLGAVTTNSAFHGTRLDVEHIGAVMEAVVRQAEARGVQRAAMADDDRVRLPRDLHAGARRLGLGRDQRAAPRVRRGGRPHRHHQHQGLHRPCDGRRHRGRGRGEGTGDRYRAARAQLPRARPGIGRAQPVARRQLPGTLRVAPGGRLRFADRDGAVALDAAGRWAAPRAGATRVRVPRDRHRRLATLARRHRWSRRGWSRSGSPAAAHRRSRCACRGRATNRPCPCRTPVA